jgi:hypothetical protein
LLLGVLPGIAGGGFLAYRCWRSQDWRRFALWWFVCLLAIFVVFVLRPAVW